METNEFVFDSDLTHKLVRRDLMKLTVGNTPTWDLREITSLFDNPSHYIHKSALRKLRYQHLFLSDGYRDREPFVTPRGIMPESDYFWALYEDFPVNQQTIELMKPRKTFSDWWNRIEPSSTITSPEVLAISSISIEVSNHNWKDLYLHMIDFHAGTFATKDDYSHESYYRYLQGMGFLRWTRLFVEMSEQLALFWNTVNERKIRAVIINHACDREKPGRNREEITYKGLRVARETGYSQMNRWYSAKNIEDVIPDTRAQRSFAWVRSQSRDF